MTYFQWNNSIASYFFRPEYAEKFIYLYGDQVTITKLGMESGEYSSEQDAWEDFLLAIKTGPPNSQETDDLIKKALSTYELWKSRPGNSSENGTEYPYYIAYLVLFVIPLTNSSYSSKRAGSYYPNFKKFAEKWGLREIRQSETVNWNPLWKDLEDWSFLIMNMDFGIFEDRTYINENWIYVGKALAQCLLPLKALKNLGIFFEKSKLTPGENISKRKFRMLLISHGSSMLHLEPATIRAIRNEEDESGKTVIDIVKQEYEKWQGDSDIRVDDQNEIRKGWTMARIFPLVKLAEWNDSVEFSYRVFSQQDFPEDLCFNEHIACVTQNGNWSKPLKLDNSYFENLELEDHFNKWKIRVVEKDIRVFISGARYNFEGWIESDYLFPGRKHLIIAKECQKESILNWESRPQKLVPLKDYDGIPEGYVLFQLENPLGSHQGLEELTLKTDLSIQLIGGLSVSRRSWLDVMLPDVLIDGANLDDEVYIEIETTNERICLSKKIEDEPIWELMDDIPVNENFRIKVQGKQISGDHLPYKLIDHEILPCQLSEGNLPKRNKFGLIVDENQSTFMSGSNVTGINYLRQNVYTFYFVPKKEGDFSQVGKMNNLLFFSNLLLYYLSIQTEASAKAYYDAFEVIFNRLGINVEEWEGCPSISNLKRNSLQMLDYLGYVDYEYSTRKIIVNPPQLILIPTIEGIKLLLIGGRTPKLVHEVLQKATDYGFIPVIEPQNEENTWYLLPDRIVIHVHSISKHKEIKCFAKECDLLLKEVHGIHPPYQLSQFGLLEYSGGIEELENQLEPDNDFPATGWICKVFDPAKLCFIKALEHEIDKNFQLVEYKINEYTFIHRLWKDGVAYPVNKNWGRYMVLKHFNKHVIFFDSEKKLFAVPATLPLPRLFMEGILLCSGLAPAKIWAEIAGIETYWHLYENVPENLIFNQFKKLGQVLIQTIIPCNYEKPSRLIQHY